MKPESASVHAGSIEDSGVVSPIQPSTAFRYLDEGPQQYPRYFNTPNQLAIVRKLCALEHADDGLLFGSGMAAISTALLSQLQPGDHAVLMNGLYGGTQRLIQDEFPRQQIESTTVGASSDAVIAAVTDRTKVIYLESPTNPCLDVIDLQAVASFARDRGIITVIDNTFASPINQNPITLGIDIVVHSGTKYLGGHSDVCCGAALGSTALIEQVRSRALNFGGSLNAITCYLLERSLKTLPIRVQRQTENAGRLAAFLKEHAAVGRVLYPGLPDHPGHAVANTQMSGFGAMLSFEAAGGASAVEVMKRLKMITPAMSLGGVESTVCVPSITSHRHVGADVQAKDGITPQLIRMSVGIEHIGDLREDLDQALRHRAMTA